MKRPAMWLAIGVLLFLVWGERLGVAQSEATEASSSAPVAETTPASSGEVADDRSDNSDSAIRKRNRQAKRVAMSALFVLVLLGFGMIAMTWLGFRMTRRYMFGETGSPVPAKPSGDFGDDWAKKPLPKEGVSPDGATDAET